MEYLLIRSKKKKYQGFAVGLGPGYTYSTSDNSEYLIGPGIATKLEYQGVLKSNWYYGAETFWIYYFNQNETYKVGQVILSYMPIILTIGFRF